MVLFYLFQLETNYDVKLMNLKYKMSTSITTIYEVRKDSFILQRKSYSTYKFATVCCYF